MAILTVPDPAIVKTLSMRFQILEGVGHLAVNLPDIYDLPSVSFDPEDFTAPQLATIAGLRDAVILKVKAREEAMAIANGNTINWTAP